MEPVSGQKLGRYTLTRRLGAGGMAEVWEATDELLKRRVAVKIVRGALAESPEFSSRFLREARLAAQLQHSGIVAVFDVGLDREALFVVMPVLSGGSLSDRLARPVDDATAIGWLKTLASALDYAHGKGVVHRDVKPLNVLFDEAGSPHLSDFGLAKGLDEATHLTQTGMILGTPLYMSPEQAMGTAAGTAGGRVFPRHRRLPPPRGPPPVREGADARSPPANRVRGDAAPFAVPAACLRASTPSSRGSSPRHHELGELLKPAPLDDKTRRESDELAQMLKGNLEKVVQHGKRADSIVKNMLQHSREGSGEHRPVDVNSLVGESLNLAYHGARAEKQGFQIRLDQNFDPAAGEAELLPQEITRVLLNLISNGFYAAMKRKTESDGSGYEPMLAVATRDMGDRVEIRIRDNGSGIPIEVKEKMFNPFFTTKPPGEGTGLGLSLSHDIVVKQHFGSIEVETQPGQFTEFKITLPRKAAPYTAGAGS